MGRGVGPLGLRARSGYLVLHLCPFHRARASHRGHPHEALPGSLGGATRRLAVGRGHDAEDGSLRRSTRRREVSHRHSCPHGSVGPQRDSRPVRSSSGGTEGHVLRRPRHEHELRRHGFHLRSCALCFLPQRRCRRFGIPSTRHRARRLPWHPGHGGACVGVRRHNGIVGSSFKGSVGWVGI